MHVFPNTEIFLIKLLNPNEKLTGFKTKFTQKIMNKTFQHFSGSYGIVKSSFICAVFMNKRKQKIAGMFSF